MAQNVKQDIPIGSNIRRIRLCKGIGQTELVHRLQLRGIEITRESFVKIERGVQHIRSSQLVAIKEELGTTFDELFACSQDNERRKE